jgi:hypothetical protein
MTDPVPVQLGFFGSDDVALDMHVVGAHVRYLADGTEVFVGEHLRWNRGQQDPRPQPRKPRFTAATDQLGLFGGASDR